MTWARLACWLLAVLGACRERTRTGGEPVTTAPAPAASRAPITQRSEIESAGLRVASGSLPARDGPGGWGFTDLELDLSRTRLEIALRRDGASLADLLPAAGLAVVNGGYFEADFRPSTWLRDAGRELAPKSDTHRGGVLAVVKGAPFVGPFARLRDEPELAVQSFPLLVEPDYQPGIHRDDGRRAARTIACLSGGRLHFVVISAPRGEGPTLFETAGLLDGAPPLGLRCSAALNLDGGPSSGVWFGPRVAARQRPPLAKVSYAIAILPRTD